MKKTKLIFLFIIVLIIFSFPKGDQWPILKGKYFGPPVNTGFDTWPSLSKDDTLYFISRRTGGEGGIDIYMSRPENGEYRIVTNPGKGVNSKYTDEDPCVAPDGSYDAFWVSVETITMQ
ncbi:MAG: hypothetical protein ABFR36_07615 [Acidobacteriota bacterium]